MAQLIRMRQRIKAVETIKKITHAMRLISMSSHSRLRHKKTHLEKYKEAFQQLWARMQKIIVPRKQVDDIIHQYRLIILVGSEKGLCGTLNSTLFKFFDQQYPAITPGDHVIAIGKSAVDYCAAEKMTTLAAYPAFSSSQFVAIAQAVADIITTNAHLYSEATVISNHQKSFFAQKPRSTVIYPLPDLPSQPQESAEEFLFEQSPAELSDMIRQLMLVVSLQELLFEALLAEHAARFLSMDSSTRNADNLLIEMKLEYNKSRQAAITRELTELATSQK
jgi:F-type H+-transporting ATPase subunit gamma